MSDRLTDEHHDWVTSVMNVDPRSYEAPADDELSGGFLSSVSDAAHHAASSIGNAASAAGHAVADTAVKVGHAVADTAVKVEHAVVHAAVTVEHAAVNAAVTVEHAAVNAAVAVEQGVVHAAAKVGHVAVEAGHAVGRKAQDVAQAVKTAVTGKAPLPPDLPTARADKQLEKLPPEDRKKVQALLDAAKSPQEKRYLTKGLAAGHTPAELEDFARKIAGKDDKWLNDNLRLVGDSKGKGIKQQWSHSCAPTTVEAIRGELDPLYAMKLREENPNYEEVDADDGMGANPKMGREQKEMLTLGGGRAVSHSEDDAKGTGKGMSFGTLLNGPSGPQGLSFDTKKIGDGISLDDAMNTMADGVSKGVPVPITVGDKDSPFAHAAVVVASSKGPPRTFTIHDPAEGKTDTFTEDQIRNDEVNVGGWKHVGVVFPPSIKV